jgi:hypothetical protein
MEENIVDWVKRISEKKDELGGFSICPFAKKALDDRKIFWGYIGVQPVTQILSYLALTPEYELVAFYNLDRTMTNDDLLNVIKECQAKMPDVVFLKDHPDEPGYINGVYTGNGQYPLILAQPRDKLNEAREKLKRTKYYDSWSDEYKNEIWSYGNES